MREKVEREGVGIGRNGSGNSRPKGYVHRLDQVATSFFFTNFPKDVFEEDLWKRFARFGRVGEVYIPKKVDKQGRRFGFVKYREVKDEWEATDLLRCISDIWFGTFKLRVNRARFHKTADPQPKQLQVNNKPVETAVGQAGRSFKGVVVGTTPVEVRQVSRTVSVPVEAIPKQPIVWEVEVEEEVLAKLEGAYVGYLAEDKEAHILQNQFRMNGFHNLKVCSMGFAKILLWSDKVGEVKEVVETVGWWCSLFERLVPWSPLLTSNNRATWIRCYGIPLHSWGIDLFRAVAFKYGRFIEVDEQTKDMMRCDFARIRILTGEKRIIDTSMAVKVQGTVFEIRVVEEIGGSVDGSGVLRKLGGFTGEGSSKASSDGGVSAEGVVVGLSESSSDADVSESCQFLLEVEKRGDRGKGQLEDLGEERYKVDGVSGSYSHNLGTHGELVVNYDVDKSLEPRMIESAVTKGMLECVVVGPLVDSKLTSGEVGLQTDGVENEANEGAITVFNGPAHIDVEETQLTNSSVVGSEEQEEVNSIEGCVDTEGEHEELEEVGVGPGPMTLRTRNGDLPINGPPFSCPSFFVALENLDSEVEPSDPIEPVEDCVAPENVISIRRQKSTAHRSTGENKKTGAKLSLNNLPFNMLRKLPGGLKEVKKRKTKKQKKKRREDRQNEDEEFDSSDSIQCYEEGIADSTQRCDERSEQSTPAIRATEEFELEVVLPFHHEE
jgi:hypothetical protein